MVLHVQTIAAVSPNAAKLITIGTPTYVQNAPFTVGATTTGIGASEQLFNVGPCLITFAEQGININPVLIQISPRLIQNDAIGLQVQPELLTIDPTFINVGPNGAPALQALLRTRLCNALMAARLPGPVLHCGCKHLSTAAWLQARLP